MGHDSLRRGRYSSPGATYFLTFCTDKRATGLHLLHGALNEHAMRLDSNRVWTLRSQVTLPDHEHLIVTLAETAELSAAIRLYRGRTSTVLRRANLRWQRGYFDHRLRPDEDRLPVFLYVHLNPYRANLVPPSEKWPAYSCRPDDWDWFGPLTNSGCPEPEWLA